MRDESIFLMQQQQAKRLSMIYRQLVFLDTRLQAIEFTLSSPWEILMTIFRPSQFWKKVNNLQVGLMHRHDEEIKSRVEKQKEESKKPKLTIVNQNGFKI